MREQHGEPQVRHLILGSVCFPGFLKSIFSGSIILSRVDCCFRIQTEDQERVGTYKAPAQIAFRGKDTDEILYAAKIFDHEMIFPS